MVKINLKYALYKENDNFYLTSIENYNARIKDANKITNMDRFASFDACIDYINEYITPVFLVEQNTDI